MFYLRLDISAKHRLDYLRGYASNRPGKTWRDVRYSTFTAGAEESTSTDEHGDRVFCAMSDYFARTKDAHEINPRLARGWYSDTNQSDTAIGIVVYLSHGRILAGYRLTMNDERVYYLSTHDDERDAANMADEHARVIAEEMREYDELWQAARELEDRIRELTDELRGRRALHRTIVAAIASADCPVRRKQAHNIRQQAANLIERIRTSRDELADSRLDSVREG